MEEQDRSNYQMPHSALVCRVCGDNARGVNFNLITCMSCKTFFRRHAYRRLCMPKCQFESNCSMTKLTRSYCSPCRLEKCFTEGMDLLLIRSVPKFPRKHNKSQRSKIKEQTQLQLSMPQTLDLLCNDRSTLTREQWDLISNIIHMYDDQHCPERIMSSINEMYSLPLKERSKLSKTSDLINQALNGVQAPIEHSAYLQSLSIDARRTLVKNNTHLTSSFNALFIFRELDLHKNMIVMNASKELYTYEVTMLFNRNSRECDPNGILIKIFIFVLFFSSNCSLVTFNDREDLRTLSSSIHLIRIQNIYVTVLWKYLVYLYGHDTAVIRFSSLIKCALNLLHIAELTINNAIHKQMLETIIAKTDRCLTIIN